jgi:hypothetical protein
MIIINSLISTDRLNDGEIIVIKNRISINIHYNVLIYKILDGKIVDRFFKIPL